MKVSFRRDAGLIVVLAEIIGPRRSPLIQLALDTGASRTVIGDAFLLAAGYDPSSSRDRRQITTTNGIEFVPILEIERISALGLSRSRFSVVSHTLPPSATVDGLLGLDFLRDTTLMIDFKDSLIDLRW